MTDWLAVIERDDPQAVPLLGRQEMVWVAALDVTGIRTFQRVAQGGSGMVSVPIPAVLAVPLLAGVERFTLLHNHPAGTLAISAHDRALTESVLHAATQCGLTLVDHVIVAGRQSVSLVARGILEAAPPMVPVAAEE